MGFVFVWFQHQADSERLLKLKLAIRIGGHVVHLDRAQKLGSLGRKQPKESVQKMQIGNHHEELKEATCSVSSKAFKKTLIEEE